MSVATELIEVIREVTRTKDSAIPIPLHEPLLEQNVMTELAATVNSGYVSSLGPSVEEFERLLSKFTGVDYVIPTSSGTSALQLALFAEGVRAGMEVAIPALSFIATANAVKHLGAEPVLLDTEKLDSNPTLGVSFDSLAELLEGYDESEFGPINKKTGARLAAIVPVHVFGRLGTYTRLRLLAKQWKLPIVEDAAGALGCFSEAGLHPGSESTSILSFNGNKTITTGGGGAILTQSKDLALAARHLSSTAKVAHPWQFNHDQIGWNFRMPSLNAALGIAQMSSLPRILSAKELLAQRYREALGNSKNFQFVELPKGQRSNNWLVCARLNEPSSQKLANVLDELNRVGIGARAAWPSIGAQKPYLKLQRVPLENTGEICKSFICLPSSPGLGTKP